MSFEVWAFFTDKTIIAIPLQHTLNQVDKFGILSKRNNILGQVKKYIDNNLDPNSNDYEIHLKRNAGSCFVSNYNPVLLKV